MPLTDRALSQTGIVADHERRLRRMRQSTGGFDPNADPVVIGLDAFADTPDGVAIGNTAVCYGNGDLIAIGGFSTAGNGADDRPTESGIPDRDCVAFGDGNIAAGVDSIAIGDGAVAGPWIHGAGTIDWTGYVDSIIGHDNMAMGDGATAGNGRVVSGTIDTTSTKTSANIGIGAGATSCGSSATSLPGDRNIAIGFLAEAVGNRGVSIGNSSEADGYGNVAIGDLVNANSAWAASSDRSDDFDFGVWQTATTAYADLTGHIAIGARSAAGVTGTGKGATAIGLGAQASHAHASAFGAEAATTEAHQIMLGTAADYVEVPGNGVVLHSPDGTRWRATVSNAGAWVIAAA